MASSNNKKIEEARANARRLIEQGPKVFIALFILTGVAYLAGSVYTRSYFSAFGASWVLEKVPVAIYFSQSWIPLLLILFFGYLATSNLTQIEGHSNLTMTTRFKVSLVAVWYGPWLLVGLLGITIVLSSLEFASAAINLLLVAIPLLLFLGASTLELFLVRFTNIDRGVDLSRAYVSLAVITAALYVVPVQLGTNRGWVDQQETSDLLNVYLRNDELTTYKLLFAAEERWYVFPTRYEGSKPPVRSVAATDVSFTPLQKGVTIQSGAETLGGP
ncbi:MAG: hypothetical protein OEV01_11560 [Nitrospira sp.]|nr:hypothetical protein [Nitrospira sp.]MDH4304582.1 hypothetical protein [Nitrospira sp.]MDH5194331.1 hypothetical protein [Nitrospira sp.]